jgi:hypothetical protein
MADPTALYYMSGTAASIAAVLVGARSYYARQRQRWTDEGAQGAKNTAALNANTAEAAKNTAAIGVLTAKLDAFAMETREKLSSHEVRIGGHDVRIGRLEDITEAPLRPRRRAGPEGGGKP